MRILMRALPAPSRTAARALGSRASGASKLKVQDGRVVICTSAACMGQGLATVLVQIAAEAAGLPKSAIAVHAPDTMVTPNSGTSTASRQTLITGEATRRAAAALKQELALRTLDQLEGREFYAEYDCVTDPIDLGQTEPLSVTLPMATQLRSSSSTIRAAWQKVVAAHDVGRAINPNGIEGQIEGGVVMGMGYALTEDFRVRNGTPAVTLGTLGLLRASQVPEIECRIIEKNDAALAYGAKGVGEIVMVTTAPAIACAYFPARRQAAHQPCRSKTRPTAGAAGTSQE